MAQEGLFGIVENWASFVWMILDDEFVHLGQIN